MTSETGSVPPLQLSLPHPPKSPHWLRCQENNCMGLPESDSALLNSFTKANQLKFAAGGWFNKLIDIMVFHTIRVIFTPLFIFHHLSFYPFFPTVDDNFDTPLFSLSFSLWDPFPPFQRWPHLFFLSLCIIFDYLMVQFTSTDTLWSQGEPSGCHRDRGGRGQVNSASGKYAEAEPASLELHLHYGQVLSGYMQ